ncbi:unnamed protein product [Notodromas monacha]|uniref:Uncharacterized protein n=1 Tax=Notodromas monacha TaxID=399045 RepID=A0A7R9BVN7_9CRUS|nr:unnamed protein product [Notodromas monacha]CAG0921087.1 unnamed protein product [Notodromas monacha]
METPKMPGYPGWDVNDWLKEDSLDEDTGIQNNRTSNNATFFDTTSAARFQSGSTHPSPRMPPPAVPDMPCIPVTPVQVPYDECNLAETDMCYVEEEEEEESEEVCYRPKCSSAAAQRNQYMSLPSNLVLSKPAGENPPIGVFPGPRPRTLHLRLLDEMERVCSVYSALKGRREEIIALGQAADLQESITCLESDVAQMENVRDALKSVNEAVCHELKISGGFAASKFGNAGMISREVLAEQRKQMAQVREERLNRVRTAIDSLMSSDKLTEEAYEAIKLLQKCPEECAEEQRRTALSLNLNLLKVSDDAFCKAVMSIDWILASFCSKEAIAGNLLRAVDSFIASSEESNPRLMQLLKLTNTANKPELRGLLETEQAQLLKSLRKSRECLLRAREAFVSKFQPIPAIHPQKSDYPKGGSRRSSSKMSGSPGGTCQQKRCLRRDDMNDIVNPLTVRNIKRAGRF